MMIEPFLRNGRIAVSLAGICMVLLLGERAVGMPSDAGKDAVAAQIQPFSILMSLQGTPGSNIDTATSPASVIIQITTTEPVTIQSVDWVLGDGTTTSGLIATNTYVNPGETSRTFIIIATVTYQTETGTQVTMLSTPLTILPGGGSNTGGEVPTLPGTTPQGGGGGSGSPCGILGMVPVLLCLFGLSLMRRRFC